MKVTPVKKNFRSNKPGDVFEIPDKAAKILIRIGRLAAAPDQGYQTRMMQAAPITANPVQYNRTEPVEAAPYGYKADGTPRLRPGRPAKAE